MAESFGTKIAKKDLEKFMNPMGFVDEKEKINYTFDQKDKAEKTENGDVLEGEHGFVVKGPEPTRFGDWERKGRCTDF